MDEEPFKLFIEYIYSGTYTEPYLEFENALYTGGPKPCLGGSSKLLVLNRQNKVWHNYTSVYLGHAKAYVFAEMYDIPDLQESATTNIFRLSEHTDLYPERTGDIVELVRYTFIHTRNTEDEPFRSEVLGIVVKKLEILETAPISYPYLRNSRSSLSNLPRRWLGTRNRGKG